ncbi:MAG: response regulator [Dehalococcoidia bacterium]|nr:response regulator [Dehalococcoidia bacterium]MDW8119354.1 response regulator [Chloroflexota bacterium]
MGLPLTVLLVEDDPTLLRTLQVALGARGYRVLTAQCVREGLAVVMGATSVDAMVIDLRLPDGLGWDLVERLRQIGRIPPPAVLISASTLSRREVREHGLEGYLPKPFSVDHLVEMVSLALKRAGRGLPSTRKEVLL